MSEDGSIETTLVEWYRRYIGEPERQVDVYAGFALFFGGVALGLVGLALFVVEQVMFGPDDTFWLREIAFAIGASGLPTLFLGVTVLLPVEKRARIGAIAGETVCLAAVAFFVWAYPYKWNVGPGTDYSMQGVGIYAVGVVTVIAATFAALVSYHVERAAPDPVVAEQTEEDTGPDVTDEDVRRDIDEAMANTEMTWGGVPKDKTRRISINETDGIDASGFEGVEAKSHRSSGGGVDAAVAGLQGMRGGEPARKKARGSGTDDQAAALAQLQEKKRKDAEREEKMADLNDGGVIGRLKSMLNIG